jgi:hypothetical protein
MDLAYALRGELITLLNKRVMANDQLNFEAAGVVIRSLSICSLLIKKPHQPSYGVVGLLFTFVDSSFKALGQDRAYYNLYRN